MVNSNSDMCQSTQAYLSRSAGARLPHVTPGSANFLVGGGGAGDRLCASLLIRGMKTKGAFLTHLSEMR